jgi:hypothetical protein
MNKSSSWTALRNPIFRKLWIATAATLFLTSLLLSRRLSISVTTKFQEKVSGFLSGRVEPEEITPIVLTGELLAA